MKKRDKAVSMILALLLLVGFAGTIALHSVFAPENTMTFTTGDTIGFSSRNETTFWSNVTMHFGTGIRIQFILTVPKPFLEPCDVIQIIWPVGYQAVPCSWWEILDPLGNPTGIEFHIDGQYGPDEFHVDQVLPPMPLLPPQPITAELKIQEVSPCDYFVVHWPEAWYPEVCSWWEIMDLDTGLPTGFEFHVDWTNESCEFHVDEVFPDIYVAPFPGVYEIEARQKITEIRPCDWFVVLDPAGIVPQPCSWWGVWLDGAPYGGRFHVDLVDGMAFHVDIAIPDPIDLSAKPEYPTIARQAISSLSSCQWLEIVGDPTNTPKPCTWWRILTDIGQGGTDVMFHVDVSYPNGTFHIDTVLPTDPWNFPSGYMYSFLIAEKNFVSIAPCDWFQVASPQGWLPEPCSWWTITLPSEWAGVSFHVDATDGVSKFHIDSADALPPGPIPPPWDVTAVRDQPPSGPWYVKPAYPDYAPSGMPDFDEKQGMFATSPGQYTWCVPVAVANSLWWLDSEYESIMFPGAVPPPTISDHFNLVNSSNPGLWDDHDPQNVASLVITLAYLMDTDGIRTHDGHLGTRLADVQNGIQNYLTQQAVAGLFEVHNSTFPEFEWIENEVEMCQDVELFLEFWQLTPGGWSNTTITNPTLELGHCVTAAGVNSTASTILISDPYQDAFEAGTAPGRSPVPHPYPHTSDVHNDTQYVSQDSYLVTPFVFPPVPPPPTGYPASVWELQGYLQTMGYDPSYHAFIRAAVATSPTGVHDVASTNLTSSKTVICRGWCGNLTVTAQNLGTFPENFNVTIYANTTVVTSLNFNLAGSVSETREFLWNTTGFAYGNWVLNASADVVLGDVNVMNNNCTDGQVRLSILGDITGGTSNLLDFVPDGKVDMKDVGVVARFFSQTAPPAPSECDVTGPTASIPDGMVDMRDVGTVARHFGEHE